MVLSKGRKLIIGLAVLAVVVLLGVTQYNRYQELRFYQNEVISGLMDTRGLTYNSPYDEEDLDQFEDYFSHIRDKRSFKKKLASAVQEEADAAFHNDYHVDEENEEGPYSMDKLGAAALESHLQRMVLFLEREQYQDESLRSAIGEVFSRDAESIRSDEREKDPLDRQADLAKYLNALCVRMLEWNQEIGKFYQLPTEEICPVDTVAEAVETALSDAEKAGDTKVRLSVLSWASESAVLGDRVFMAPEKIVALVRDEDARLMTLRSGIGGYYDTQPEKEKRHYFGDFYKEKHTYGGNAYDTTYFTPGVWQAIGSEMRNFIQDANEVKTNVVVRCRGRQFPSFAVEEMLEKGFDFVYVNPDDTMVFVSRVAVTYLCDGHVEVIGGDFTEIYEEMEKNYQGTDEAQEALLAKQAFCKRYTGAFGTDGEEAFQSKMWMEEGKLYWQCTPSEKYTEFFVVKFGFNSVPLFREPMEVVSGKAVRTHDDDIQEEAEFSQDGAIHCICKVGGTLAVDQTFTPIPAENVKEAE